MIHPPRLLKDLQRQLKWLEDDLRERIGEVAEIDAGLRKQFRSAKEAGRTGDAYEVWRDDFLTQAAVAWILGCVFGRGRRPFRCLPNVSCRATGLRCRARHRARGPSGRRAGRADAPPG